MLNAAALPGLVELDLLGKRRSGADEAHLSFEDVDELREHARLSQEPSNRPEADDDSNRTCGQEPPIILEQIVPTK